MLFESTTACNLYLLLLASASPFRVPDAAFSRSSLVFGRPSSTLKGEVDPRSLMAVVMGSPKPVVYPQADPSRKGNSAEWYDLNPEPGKSRQACMDYLSVEKNIIIGLESQVREKLEERDAQIMSAKPAEARRHLYRAIADELMLERGDLHHRNMPEKGLNLLIQQIVTRIAARDKQQKGKCAKPCRATANSINSGNKRRRMTVSNRIAASVSDSDENDFSEWEPRREAPCRDVAGEQLTADAVGQKTSLGSTPNREAPIVSPYPKINPCLIWLRIRDPENPGRFFVKTFSELSETEIDLQTCASVQIECLWQCIHQDEVSQQWAFFDEKEDFLWCRINDEPYIVCGNVQFIFTCRAQIAAALQRDPSCTPILEFERRIKPKDRQIPSSPRQPGTFGGPPNFPTSQVLSLTGAAPPAVMTPRNATPGQPSTQPGTASQADNNQDGGEAERAYVAPRPLTRQEEQRLPALPGSVRIANPSESSPDDVRLPAGRAMSFPSPYRI